MQQCSSALDALHFCSAKGHRPYEIVGGTLGQSVTQTAGFPHTVVQVSGSDDMASPSSCSNLGHPQLNAAVDAGRG